MAIVGLALLSGAGYLALTHSARGRFFAATHLPQRRDAALRELSGAMHHGLAKVDVSASAFRSLPPPASLDSAWTVTLPPRLPLAEANLAVTTALAALGATVWDAVETREGGQAAVRMTVGSHREALAEVTLISSVTQVVGAPSQRLALIFTDATATTLRQLRALFAARVPCTVAIAAATPGADTLARVAVARGAQVMVALPMEAKGAPPSDGDILVDMSASDIAETVERAFQRVPGASGAVNKNGSLALQDPHVMTAVLRTLHERGVFFVEVPVTTDSVCRKIGRQLGAAVMTADETLDARYSVQHGVQERLRHLAATVLPARQQAIVTARGDSLTCVAVLAELDSLAARGVSLVPLSALAP